MKIKPEFVEGCEALAQAFEDAARPDLAAMCDRAAYWLNGGDGIALTSVGEVVASCRDTLKEAFDSKASLEGFMARTADEIVDNLRMIEAEVVTASSNSEDLIEKAAKLQAIAILTSDIFK